MQVVPQFSCKRIISLILSRIAFGLFARTLEKTSEFEHVCGGTEGLELADSIAGDAHKMLNVPYDCGFFFSRHSRLAKQVLRNPNAAYLKMDTATDDVASPLNTGLENSRRFRALPVYATLVSYGRDGYSKMLQRQIRFARKVAWYFSLHYQFDLLPQSIEKYGDIDHDVYVIVLFRAKDTNLNNQLVSRINETSQIYVSGTTWQDRPASRIAAANWQIEPEFEANLVIEVIEALLRVWKQEING